MVAYFQNPLVEHLGRAAASGSFAALGLSDREIIQIETEGGLESFIRVTGEFDGALCTELLTWQQANERIEARFIPRYEVVNQTLMAVSLNQKMADGSVDLAKMQPDWPLNEQNKFLYDCGVLGILRSQPRLFEEEVQA